MPMSLIKKCNDDINGISSMQPEGKSGWSDYKLYFNKIFAICRDTWGVRE